MAPSKDWHIRVKSLSNDSVASAGNLERLGYSPHSSSTKGVKAGSGPTQATLKELKEAKAWEIAKGPIKQLPMNIFMMWMAGNTVHIFSLMMVFMMVMNPIKALSNVSVAFGTLATDSDIDVTYHKAAYVLLNIAALGLPAYKANSMGLWPSTADFLYGEAFDPRLEVAGGGMAW